MWKIKIFIIICGIITYACPYFIVKNLMKLEINSKSYAVIILLIILFTTIYSLIKTKLFKDILRGKFSN